MRVAVLLVLVALLPPALATSHAIRTYEAPYGPPGAAAPASDGRYAYPVVDLFLDPPAHDADVDVLDDVVPRTGYRACVVYTDGPAECDTDPATWEVFYGGPYFAAGDGATLVRVQVLLTYAGEDRWGRPFAGAGTSGVVRVAVNG